MAEPDRCYICLGNNGEAPPLARPDDSSELIQICDCSLRAHKRCLTDWATDVEYRSRDDTPSVPANRNRDFTIGVPVAMLNVGNKSYRLTQTKVKCPQCGTPLYFMFNPSRLLSFYGLIYSGVKELSRFSAITAFSSATGFALFVSIGGVFISGGLQMFLAIAPESVLTKLLDFKSRSLDQELRSDGVGLKQLFLMGSFPVFLFGLRSDNPYLDVFSSIYPTIFFKGRLENLLKAGPKAYLLFTEPLKRLYWLFYSLTFNRVYYRWTRMVKPIFLADRLSIEELNEIEGENASLKKSFKETTAEENQGFFGRIYHFLFHTSAEQKALFRKKLWRETKAVLLRDFSKVFDDQSLFVKVFTTVLWPFLGAKLGKVLLRVVKINSFCNKYGSTPDESMYIANLLGSVAVVLIKDLLKLYVAWHRVNQLMDLSVVEHRPVRPTFTSREYLSQFERALQLI